MTTFYSEEPCMPEESKFCVYNTANNRKEQLVPREPGRVKMFTCGPSVYRRQHLGNYRTFLFEDLFQRYMEYRGFEVERSLNMTDLEDKAIDEAKEKGVSLQELTRPVIDEFLDSCRLLEIKLPPFEIPRATTSVEEAVHIILKLLERGHAYWYKGNVYFDPLSFPGFGEVFGLDMSNWPEKRYRFSKDTYEGLRWNLGDFILWHGNEKDEAFSWNTELGRGRPAWNVQDPAMISKTLGYEIDVHCGGIDNVYRHHDYNRAVMEGVSGKEFCHYWVHGEHLIVEGRKMSKSRGNVLYPKSLLEKGASKEAIRFSLIYGYYRKKLNMTDEHLEETTELLERFRRTVGRITRSREATKKPPRPESEAYRTDRMIAEIPRLFRLNMDNDLHVKQAVDDVMRLCEHLDRRADSYGLTERQAKQIDREIREIDEVLRSMFPRG
ncbi:MAG: class I tRNA ligase family protein [Spirochaetaceae bacterium]